jgi:hypothetical protein
MGIHKEHPKLGHRLMGKKILPLFAGSFLLLTTASAADAAMILRLEQVGGDVVVRGNGTINTDGLTSRGTYDTYANVFSYIQVYAGPAPEVHDGHVEFWSGLTGGTATISSSAEIFEPDFSSSASFGNLFGIVTQDTREGVTFGLPLLVLPQGYLSGAVLSGTTRFSGKTFAGMGITPGTLTWTLPTTDTVTITTDAEPVPAPLGVASAAAVFSYIRRLKQNTRILQLAARKPKAISTSLPD